MSDGFIIKRGGSGASGGGVDPSIIERTATNVTADMLQGVTSIGESAFRNWSGLTSITIPNSVTSIGKYAFNECSSLASIEIPNSVTSIGSNAFASCESLTSIDIPNSVTSIGDLTFQYCSGLTSITIPDSVTSIGNYAFEGCRSLTSATVKAITPPILGSNIFINTPSSLVIYVPAESVDAYKAYGGWSNFADKIQAIPSD